MKRLGEILGAFLLYREVAAVKTIFASRADVCPRE